MIVQEMRVLRGPNFWSIKYHKLIQMLVDLEDLEYKPTNQIKGFAERLQHIMPSLYEHHCSEGRPGGFFERVQQGTWMGHVIEHIALEIQSLAGMRHTGFGRTRGAGREGLYHVVFSYEEEQAGLFAARAAVQLTEALIDGSPYNLQEDIQCIQELWYHEKLGPTTYSIVEEAAKRDIPFIRLDEGSLIQLGYGARQKRVEAAVTSGTGTIAADIACDKDRTKRLLTSANIPVPFGEVVTTIGGLKDVIAQVGFPIVLKPLNSNQGKGATINITNWPCAITAFNRAARYSDKIIVEKYIPGSDFRVLVINNKFVAAALRKPACVVGDGRSTIQELIEAVNRDPRRGHCHEKALTAIVVDEVTLELLANARLTLDTVLPMGEELQLKPTANLSTGGTAMDVTDDVHPDNIFLFERLSRIVGLDICGIDIMAADLKTPLRENGGVVIEVNAAPGFRMHLEPTVGQSRNVAKYVVDMLFKNSHARIPVIAITGTNGKTTTSRLIAQMARQAGFTTGLTTTDGIYINDHMVLKGDCSGPQSAQCILKDPCVEFAVLETARGGILRSGLGFDKCDCAVVTNVAEDHLGLDGVDSIEKLAKVKSVVPETVHASGYTILNADDDLVYAMKDRIVSKLALFSLHSENVRIEEHCRKGGLAAVYENGFLLIRTGNHLIPIEEVKNVPITFGGKADFNIANALAAALAAYTNHIKLNAIREVLRMFVPSHETTPGRVNFFDFGEFRVVLDYAHNPHAVRALGHFITSLNARTRVGIITGVGDRRDEDIISLGAEAARIFNEVIIRHDDDLRGRTVEEVENLITQGIVSVSPDIPITYSMAECEAVVYAIDHATPGSLIVVLTEDIRKATECILSYQQRHKQQISQWQAAV